jgi:D-alanine-D-alanine ligase
MSPRVIVLFGGTSSERRVSVASAQHFFALLPDVVPWFIDPGGKVHPCETEAVKRHAQPFEKDLPLDGPPRWPSLPAALESVRERDAVFLLALHGGDGENGVVQAQLEKAGVAFTGSGAAASARAFDKRIAKALVAKGGVPVAAAVTLPPSTEAAAGKVLRTFFETHGACVLKPVADGSSVGLHHLKSADQVPQLASTLAAQKQEYLIEAFVAGVELTVGVVEGPDGLRALPVSEVRTDPHRAFDYEGKYLGKGAVEITPAEVSEVVSGQAKQLAIAAHAILGCRGYTRTDIIASEKGPTFLEINTLPGMTRRSFIPQQLEAEGTSIKAFLEGQLALARTRSK